MGRTTGLDGPDRAAPASPPAPASQPAPASPPALASPPAPASQAGWDAACIAHRCSASEREAFERDGFLAVEGALDPDLRSRLLAVAAEADAEYRARPDVGPYHVLNQHDLIGRHDAYLELVDLPTTFPKVWGVLGWHIQVFHTQLVVTPPAPRTPSGTRAPAGRPGGSAGGYGWHQDNNRMNLDLETSPQPRISVKVGYFLTALPEPGMGNLCVVPGSHTRPRPEVPVGTQPDGAVEVVARAGDALVFDRRLWHSASTNHSEVTRVFVTVGYSYRWLRPKSEMDFGAWLDGLPPIRRQMLGAVSSANGWFDPTDDDVPLRAWIHDHLGSDAVVP